MPTDLKKGAAARLQRRGKESADKTGGRMSEYGPVPDDVNAAGEQVTKMFEWIMQAMVRHPVDAVMMPVVMGAEQIVTTLKKAGGIPENAAGSQGPNPPTSTQSSAGMGPASQVGAAAPPRPAPSAPAGPV